MLPLPAVRRAGSTGLRKGQRPGPGLATTRHIVSGNLSARCRLAYNPAHLKRCKGGALTLHVTATR